MHARGVQHYRCCFSIHPSDLGTSTILLDLSIDSEPAAAEVRHVSLYKSQCCDSVLCPVMVDIVNRYRQDAGDGTQLHHPKPATGELVGHDRTDAH